MAAGRVWRAAAIAALVPIGFITLGAQGPGVLQDRPVPALRVEPPMLGFHFARGEAGKAKPGSGGSTPNLTLHGGNVMPTTYVEAIFWGPSWGDTAFVADKISGIESWHQGLSGSSFANTSNEYKGTDNKLVTSAIGYGGYHIDTSPVPDTVSKITTPTFNEMCKVIGTQSVANGYYPVYVDVKRGTAGFCAYHSYGTCNNVPVQFGFFFNLDGDAGCDPQDSTTGHSQGLAALVNVSAHEISEARTDPRGSGWYDRSGAENADKCAWAFGTPSIPVGTQSWKMQGNWSNAAYNAGTGYANRSGETGCIDGGNFR